MREHLVPFASDPPDHSRKRVGPTILRSLGYVRARFRPKPSALLIDSEAAVAKQYGAKTTPHMFVIDPQGTMIYAGAIDDKRSVSLEDVPGAHNYIKAARDEVLGGKPVSIASTQPYGCPVKY